MPCPARELGVFAPLMPVLVGRLQPVLLRSSGAMEGASQVRMKLRPDKLAGKSACATEKNDVARAPSIGDRGACYVGTGRDACATERRNPKGNAVCYDFGLVARCLLAAVMWDFVAQH